MAKLVSTKKSLGMMNTGTKQLNRILITGKASSDYHGLGYQNGIASCQKNVFVKASSSTAIPPLALAKLPNEMKGKSMAHYTSG